MLIVTLKREWDNNIKLQAMNKIKIIILALFASTAMVHAQSEADAFRFSLDMPSGTARSLSMGNAFGALGGDFSAILINPAGTGVYRNSEFTFTPSISYNNTMNSYFGTLTEDFNYNFNINNLGYVATFRVPENTGWVSTSLAIGFNRMNDYNSNEIIKANGVYSSMVDYFWDYGAGFDPNTLDAYWERLAFDAYIIDTLPGSSGIDYSPVFSDMALDQVRTITTEGAKSEFTIAFGANYGHQLYIGASLGIQSIRYETNRTHTENESNADLNTAFNDFTFNQNIKTSGTGVNFKVGAIYKPVDFIRLGASLHLPTFYDLTDEMYNTMESNFVDYRVLPTDSYGNNLDALVSEYSLTTPLKLNGSIALVYKIGLISIDYEMIDYSNMRMRASDYDFNTENEYIEAVYKRVGNLRIGGELRFGPLSLRGGYAYHASPYKSNELNKDSDYSTYSGGVGFRQKNYFMDFGYSFATNQQFNYPYTAVENSQPTKTTSERSRYAMTVGFRF